MRCTPSLRPSATAIAKVPSLTPANGVAIGVESKPVPLKVYSKETLFGGALPVVKYTCGLPSPRASPTAAPINCCPAAPMVSGFHEAPSQVNSSVLPPKKNSATYKCALPSPRPSPTSSAPSKETGALTLVVCVQDPSKVNCFKVLTLTWVA